MLKSYFSRLRIFFSERYPLVVGFISALVGVLSMYFIWAAITPGASVIISKGFINACFSMFLLMLILRLCDEIKDKEADARLFPERCLPSGKVRYSDIYLLLGICSVIFVVINLIWGGDPTLLVILLIYIFLFFKYFFLPQIISQNILLALVSHNPLMLVTSLYIISIFAKEQELSVFSSTNFLLAIGFWMPSFVWETARKIRAPEKETDYETYSVALGPRLACLLPLGGNLVQLLIIIYLVRDLSSAHLIIYGSSFLYLLYSIQFVLFMKSLKHKYAKYFQVTTEGHIVANSVLIVLISLLELMR